MTDSFAGKVVVVLGATGDVGSGAAYALLSHGATVVLAVRNLAKGEDLKKRLLEYVPDGASRLLFVQGSFESDDQAQKSRDAIVSALNGLPIDHVINCLGNAGIMAAGVIGTKWAELATVLNDGLSPILRAAQVFLPLIKDREGSTYTGLSGGLAYVCPQPTFWAMTVKNAALNALTLGLQAEAKDWKVRINNLVIKFGIAPFDGATNQLGAPSVSTRDASIMFVRHLQGTARGKNIDVHSVEDAATKSFD